MSARPPPSRTWRTLWWGSEQAPLARKAGIVGLLVCMGLSLCGLWVDFVPAPGLYGGHAAGVFFVVGLALSIVVLLRGQVASNLARAGRAKAVFGIVFMPFMFGFLLWLTLVKALPWALTRTFGSPHSVEARMRTEHQRSRRSCDYRIEGGPLERTLPDYLCITPAYYEAHPDSTVVVKLSGRRSALGFAIISASHARNASE